MHNHGNTKTQSIRQVVEGYKLKVGEITKNNFNPDQLWQYFNAVFSSKSKNQASYKFVFLRSILENIYCADNQLKFHLPQLFQTFTKIYWNLVVKEKYKQSDKSHEWSGIEKTLFAIKERANVNENFRYEKLPEEVRSIVEKEGYKVGKRYVVGALYGDTNGYFYGFSISESTLQLHPTFATFAKTHRDLLLKVTNYELAKFLCSNNPNAAISIHAIEHLSERKDLSAFKRILIGIDSNCFYCTKNLNTEIGIEVDHFIPWSYFRDDQLWNFVLACKKCNNKKRDKLPEAIYLERLVMRNNATKHLLSKDYSDQKLLQLHEYAVRSGITIAKIP